MIQLSGGGGAFLKIFLPFLLALIIYVFLRSERPVLLELCLAQLGILIDVPVYRSDNFLYRLVLFNLPDGLWSFSFSSFIVHSGKEKFSSGIYIYLAFTLAIMQEFAQMVFPYGTFDPIDVVFIAVFLDSASLPERKEGSNEPLFEVDGDCCFHVFLFSLRHTTRNSGPQGSEMFTAVRLQIWDRRNGPMRRAHGARRR